MYIDTEWFEKYFPFGDFKVDENVKMAICRFVRLWPSEIKSYKVAFDDKEYAFTVEVHTNGV